MDQMGLYQQLSSLGDYYPLNLKLNLSAYDKEILQLSDHWKSYNPRKKINRYGLSLTSLDGGMSGVPDLDSIYEYNILNDTNYEESDFRVKTDAFRLLPCISEALGPFSNYLGRSHIIRLDSGGFFPYHRDCDSQYPKCFRLFAPLKNCGSLRFAFLYEGRSIHFEPMHIYFMDTRKSHALFSFNDDCHMLVSNILLESKTVNLIKENLA